MRDHLLVRASKQLIFSDSNRVSCSASFQRIRQLDYFQGAHGSFERTVEFGMKHAIHQKT